MEIRNEREEVGELKTERRAKKNEWRNSGDNKGDN